MSGRGEMAAMVRAYDWSRTALGPQHAWPQSLKTLAGLVLAAPSPIILLWGPELVQIYNDGYRDIMGAKHPGSLGQPNRNCWPEVWDFTASVYAGVQRGESFTFVDQRLVLERHGYPEETFFTLAFSPVPDDAGQIGGILVTVNEITERVRAVAAREASERRFLEVAGVAGLSSDFRALFEASPTPLVVVAPPDFTIIAANDAYLHATSTTRPIVIGRPMFEVFPDNPADAQASGVRNLRASFDRVLATGRTDVIAVQRYDLPSRDAAGGFQERWWSPINSPVFSRKGEVIAIIQRVEDVTETVRLRSQSEAQEQLYRDQQAVIARLREANRELAESRALRESEERFRLMANTVPQIIWITDAEGRTEFFNKQWTLYTGAEYVPTTARSANRRRTRFRKRPGGRMSFSPRWPTNCEIRLLPS